MPRARFRYALAVLVILGIAGAVAWRQLGAAPTWYRPPDSGDPRIVQLADDVEYRLVEEVHRLRDEPFSIRLREEHANAWLAARLPRWIAGRGAAWPSALGMPQVRIAETGIDVAGPASTSAGRRYLAARAAVQVSGGELILSIAGLSVGRMSIRGSSADGLLAILAPEERAELMASEAGSILLQALQGGAAIEPVFRLADGRQVRLTGIVLNRGSMDLTFAPVEQCAP